MPVFPLVTSKKGAVSAGSVTFYPLSDAKSQFTLQMEYVPNGIVEQTGDAMGLVTRRVEEDLNRFSISSKAEAQKQARGEALSNDGIGVYQKNRLNDAL